MPKRLCKCLGCSSVTSSGDFCWTCWANRQDKRDCQHTLDALARLNRSGGNLSRYYHTAPADPGWA